MEREQIVFVGTSDLSGHFRGKSFPAADLASRLQRGVGLAPTNIYMSAFGPIHVTTFGTAGEVMLVPDPSTRVYVPFDDGTTEYFYIGDIRTLEGTPWHFCPRQLLRTALERLRTETGLSLLATFEQELIYDGVRAHPWQPYELDAYRQQGTFGETLLGALRQAGVVPDSFLSEYGPCQFEVTCAPALGVRAADDAVITRELTQAVAWRHGHRASFTPVPTPDGIGNGTHVHFSFLDAGGRPVLYAPERPLQLSEFGSRFVAGIQHHLPGLCGLFAASVPSYYRLRPNRWAPVYADVGALDRGAALRISPVSGDESQRARQFNVEFRVADATANPYLLLAALVQAGLEGVRARRAIEEVTRRELPSSLGDALSLLERGAAADWFGADLVAGYVLLKRAEIKQVENLEEAEICRRYAEVY